MRLQSNIGVIVFTLISFHNQYCLQIYYHRFHLFTTEMKKKQTNELRYCCLNGFGLALRFTFTVAFTSAAEAATR